MIASSQGHDENVQEQMDVEHGLSVAFKAEGYERVHGVAAHYVKGSEGNEENHAIALVLGRLCAFALVKNIPDQTVLGLLALFHSAGVDIGQKHHHCAAISSFAGIVASMCLEGVARSFADKPRNLQHPSCWRLIYDGVTLGNGSTVTVVLICFTSAQGDIEVELLGCTRTSAFSDATHTGTGIMNLLTKTLQISDSNARCDSTTGLRCAHVPASSRDPLKVHEAESRSVHRGMFLTCMVADRAYTGFSGTRLDEWLGEKLGVWGILGRARRIGMADLFHCFDGCARKVWDGDATGRREGKKSSSRIQRRRSLV